MEVLESALNDLFREVYEKRLPDLIPNALMFGEAMYKLSWEDSMPNYATDSCKGVEETPIQRELNQLKGNVKDLRDGIARKQEQLRIELAKLAAVKKLAKGGK